MNYQAFEEKKEFKLVIENDVHVNESKEGHDNEEEDEVTETSDVVVVRPENLRDADGKGLEMLN